MQKAIRYLRNVVGGVLFLGFCVQIGMGLLWMVLVFTGSLVTGESLFCVETGEVAAHLQCLLQLALASFAAYRFLREIGITARKNYIWGTLAMLTFPMAMQCHLSLGADSLISSLLLLGMACIIGILRTPPLERKSLPYKKRVMTLLLSAVLLVGVGTLEYVQKYSSEHESFAATMTSRFAWTSLNESYSAWPQELQDILPARKVREATFYADNITEVLVPYLEEVYGRDTEGERQVQATLWEISRMALSRNTKGIAREILWDAVGYTFAPIVLQLQLDGKGYDSYSGVNYDRMLQQEPHLSQYYMNYGCKWFAAALLLALAITLMNRVPGRLEQGCGGKYTESRRELARRCLAAPWVCVIMSGVLVAWYTMRGAGMMDYRKTIVVVLLWIAWMVRSTDRSGYADTTDIDIGSPITGDTHNSGEPVSKCG